MRKTYDIEGRDSLLIVLGDSWTEGVGAYSADLLKKFNKKEINTQELYDLSVENRSFFYGGWPYKLSKILNYDLINLAVGGGSNSGAAKRLLTEFVYPHNTKYLNVLVLWLLTDDARFSFYSHGILHDYHAGNSLNHNITKAYLGDVYTDKTDGLLETRFYLKSVESFCRYNSFNFAYGSAFTDIDNLNEIYKSDFCIHNYITERNAKEMLFWKEHWAHCGHPSELGHEIIADRIHTVLCNNFNGRF